MKLLSIKKLPLVPVLVAIFLAIILILFVNAYSKREAFSKFNLWGGKETIVESQTKDSDNDGLQDWQEDLYKTDYLNPDTDGDGYLDGEEINSGHNPLVKAPGDTQMFYPLPIGDQYNITKKVLSEKTMQSIIDSYLAQKAEYLNDHPNISSQETFTASVKTSTIQEMFLRALSDSYPTLLEEAEKTISEMPEIFDIEINDKDIEISENNSQEAIKSYLAAVSAILNADNFLLQEKSLQAISSAFENADFSQLDAIIKANDEKIERAKAINVPSSWKEIHKEGLKLTLILRNIFVSFRDLPNDPIKAYVALPKLEKFPTQWNDLMQRAIDLAKTQGINLSL